MLLRASIMLKRCIGNQTGERSCPVPSQKC